MSGKGERERRREERIAEESQAVRQGRRKRVLQLSALAVFAVLIAVVVGVVLATSDSGGGGDAENVAETGAVDSLLAGIPQQELVLGKPSAPVELIEFGDLQCPVCKEYSEEFLPEVIESAVKTGEAKIAFRNFPIISEESVPAGAAAIAAGQQGRGWNFIELFYRNQGEERSGYVTDDFLTSIAEGAGVADIGEWNEVREDPKTIEEVERTSSEAQRFGFNGTPSFAIEGPGTNGVQILSLPQSVEELEAAIKSAGA